MIGCSPQAPPLKDSSFFELSSCFANISSWLGRCFLFIVCSRYTLTRPGSVINSEITFKAPLPDDAFFWLRATVPIPPFPLADRSGVRAFKILEISASAAPRPRLSGLRLPRRQTSNVGGADATLQLGGWVHQGW